MKKLFIFIFIICNFFISEALVANSKKDFVPSSFRVKFEQSFKSTISGKLNKSQGQLGYRYPGQFRFEVFSPDKSIFVSNGKKSWYYTPPFDKDEEGEVVEKNDPGPFLPEFFDALKKGLKSGSIFTVEKKKDFYLITFSKDFSKKIGKSSTKLFFSTSNPTDISSLKEMVIVGTDNSEVHLVLSDFDEQPGSIESDFVFKIPPKTHISH